ncbi:MAG TPA: RHS repeat-associated core domain-containing protein, partial [Lentimicrobium sp.]|nr:RHS repeat-associated core domain-containing protein [Lentimicrobium sp.]
FIGNFVYIDGVLEWNTFDEGRVVYPSTGVCFFENHVKDHLGNVRVTYSKNGTIANARDVYAYYPFGMGINSLTATYVTLREAKNEYLYNGKMYQDELGLNWYDYGARFYDPVVARWWSVDPLGEKYRKLSLYNFCINNPIRFIDPDGNEIVDANGKPVTYSSSKGWSSNATNDVKRIGNALLKTRAGTEQFNKMVNSKTKISLEISQDTKVAGNTYNLGKMLPGRSSKEGSNIKLEDAKLIVYEGTINRFMEDTKNSNDKLAQEYQANTTNNDERIAAVAGHEIEHLTPENLKLNDSGSTDVEKKPREIEKKILSELGSKLTPMKPLIPNRIEKQ